MHTDAHGYNAVVYFKAPSPCPIYNYPYLFYFVSHPSFLDSFGPATHNHDHSTKWINCRMDNGTSLVIDDHNALGVPAQQFPRRVDVDIQPDGSISSVTLAPLSLAVNVLDDAGVSIVTDDDDGASSSLTSGSYANLNGGTDSSSTTAGAGGGRKRKARNFGHRNSRATDDYKTPTGVVKLLMIE